MSSGWYFADIYFEIFVYLNRVAQVEVKLIKIIIKIKSVLWKRATNEKAATALLFIVHCNQNNAVLQHGYEDEVEDCLPEDVPYQGKVTASSRL